MKNSILFFAIILLFGCESTGYESILTEDLSNEIKTRSDAECDECIELDVPTCCCKVELQSISPTMDISICGVYFNHTGTCTGTNIGDCYTLSNKEIRVTLNSNNPYQYFCILENAPFRLWNHNSGLGAGWIRIGCSSTGNPTGAIAMNIPNGTERYYQSSGCDLEICPN